jgi:hypothetical protein
MAFRIDLNMKSQLEIQQTLRTRNNA